MPITKVFPKELLPIIDTPVLSFIIDEAANSGITDVLLVISPLKEDIRKYFTPNSELEEKLVKAGKLDVVELLRSVYAKVNITFAYQNSPLGSGDAVYQAKSFTGDEPFCLAWGDDLICADKPVMSQLISAYEKYDSTIIGAQYMASDEIVKYGVADILSSDGKAHLLRGIVEKPALTNLPSRIASLGRYVVKPEVYATIENTSKGRGGEIQFTDALNATCAKSSVYAYEFEGKRYDMGDKFGSLTAQTEFALKNPEFGEKYRAYIKELALKL
jgi:UTP--glucose-1-phosphate uridylyltransferase